MAQGGSSLSRSLEDVLGKVATAQQCVFLHLSLGRKPTLWQSEAEKYIPSLMGFGFLS